MGGLLLFNSESVSLYLPLLLIPKKAAHRPSETVLLICVQSGSTQAQKSLGNSERWGFFLPRLHFAHIQHVVHVSKGYVTYALKPNSSKTLVPTHTVPLEM